MGYYSPSVRFITPVNTTTSFSESRSASHSYQIPARRFIHTGSGNGPTAVSLQSTYRQTIANRRGHHANFHHSSDACSIAISMELSGAEEVQFLFDGFVSLWSSFLNNPGPHLCHPRHKSLNQPPSNDNTRTISELTINNSMAPSRFRGLHHSTILISAFASWRVIRRFRTRM